MASRKLTALPTATEVTISDKIYIVDVSDTTESPQGTSKQATVSELPTSGIPLSGTAEGAPLTGVIEVQSGYLAQWTNGDVVTRVGISEDGDYSMERKDLVTGAVSLVFLGNPSNPQVNLVASDGTKQTQMIAGFSGSNTFQAFETERIGYFNKANSTDASAQAAAIANATNSTDVITQLNTLLAAMRAYGLIAE